MEGDAADTDDNKMKPSTSKKMKINEEGHNESCDKNRPSTINTFPLDTTTHDENSLLARNNNENSNNTNLLGETVMHNDENKVSRATLTDIDNDSSDKKCKYCKARLSKLRWLERVKSRRSRRQSLRRKSASSSSNDNAANKGCQTSASLFEKAEMTQKELQSIAMILRFKCGRTSDNETYCKCVMHGKARDCRCGEEDEMFDWVWDSANRPQATNLLENGNLALFHKDYSCGTAAVRGNMAMSQDQHFWEIKMTTPVYGTDMMIGVGTEEVELNSKANSFCSMLGNDADSWGISYDGRIHHNKRKQEYCGRFGQGAIIGVHLDMWHGTLSFFKNRQPLGTAFTGLRGRSVYPMACSTAARSGMKIISSRSFPTSLQFMCCQTLRRIVPSHLSVLDTLAMPPGLRAFLANNMTWLLHALPPKFRRSECQEFICEICMPLKSVLEGLTDDEDSDDEKAGSNFHVLKFVDSDNESEDDVVDNDDDDASDHLLRHCQSAYSPSHSDIYGTLPRRGPLPVGGSSSFTDPLDADFFSHIRSIRNRYSSAGSVGGSSGKRRRLITADASSEEEEEEEEDEEVVVKKQKICEEKVEEKDKKEGCVKDDSVKELVNKPNDDSQREEDGDDEYDLDSYAEAGPSTSRKRKRK